MAKNAGKGRKAGAAAREQIATRGDGQRESAARMAAQRIDNVKRIQTKIRHLEIDPRTKRRKR